MVEGARLESVYRLIPYPGFESPSLRQERKKWSPLRVAIFFVPDGEAGIRRPAPAGAGLSESPICHRRAVARRQALARSAIYFCQLSSTITPEKRLSGNALIQPEIHYCFSKSIRRVQCFQHFPPLSPKGTRRPTLNPTDPNQYLVSASSMFYQGGSYGSNIHQT